MEVEIRHCNNIREWNLHIEEWKINIFYWINGTWKSTISKAIYLKVNWWDLNILKPFSWNNVPEVILPDTIRNILIFNEDYINDFVYKNDELLSNSFDIFIKTDQYKENEGKINELLWWIKDVVEFFILPFPSEKETYSIIIPFLEFNKNKVNYKKLTADLPNFNNYKTYAVVNISDSDNNKLWKKFLSFLLWIFYILVRFFLIFFFFIPFFLYYFIAEKLTSFIFWWLWSASENWWVISKPISFLYYSSILVSLVWILVWLLIFIPMFNFGFDYINNIFWYILSNYLDYSFFVWFVNWFFVFLWFWIISHLVYIFFKNK